MASANKSRYRVSAQNATTATLLPVTGEKTVPDMADNISQIVITWANARDTIMFDIVERQFDIEINRK